jgi:hypothetical protein
MRSSKTTEPEEVLYDMAFGTHWEPAYVAAIERLAFEAAAKCVHQYDPAVFVDAVAASIYHPEVKSELARKFVEGIRLFINKELDLELEIEMTRYGGEHGGGGAVYGRVEPHMSDTDIVERVARLLISRCGAVPDWAVDFEGRCLVEWLLECIEVADSGDAGHYPAGDCAAAIAERLQHSGVVLECLRKALRKDELDRRLGDPAAVAAEMKYRPRTQYF